MTISQKSDTAIPMFQGSSLAIQRLHLTSKNNAKHARNNFDCQLTMQKNFESISAKFPRAEIKLFQTGVDKS